MIIQVYVLIKINYNDVSLIQNIFIHIQLNQMKIGFQNFKLRFQLVFINMINKEKINENIYKTYGR